MSVLIKIKDMKMPSSCLNCKFTDKKFTSLGVFINCNLGLGSVVGYGTGNHVGDRHPNCPLVELPEHYGDLVDVKEIRWDDHYDSDGNLSKYKIAYSDEMPDPIIKGEQSNNECIN